MTREEAIEKIRQMSLPKETMEILEALAPELKESEDERIINQLITLVDSTGEVLLIPTNKEELIAWLEKQKDASYAIEAVERIDKYIDEHLANAHDMKDSNPDKKYYRGWDDALGKMAGILQDVYSGEKQKESLRDFIDNFPYSDEQKEQKTWKVGANAYFTPEQKPADLSKMMVHKEPYIAPVPTPMVGDEQKPAEWSDTKELVFKDICKHLKEEGYNGWVALLEALHSGEFKQPDAEWSEEDEKIITRLIDYFESFRIVGVTTKWEGLDIQEVITLLKSRRPSWKPSEEQMGALEEVIVLLTNLRRNTGGRKNLESLYEQLKKLM